MIDTRPGYVARCARADDVVEALAFARGAGARGRRARRRPRRHRPRARATTASCSTSADDRRRRGRPARRVARVGGGATWAAGRPRHPGARPRHDRRPRLDHRRRRAHARRRLGLARAQARPRLRQPARRRARDRGRRAVRASADENPELLWALRGGGGNFGVVTALELPLHPVGPEVLAGMCSTREARPASCCARFRDVMRDARRRAQPRVHRATVPEDPDFHAAWHGQPAVVVAGMWAGELADGRGARCASIRGARGADRGLLRRRCPTRTSSACSTTRPATATTGPPSRPATSRTRLIDAIVETAGTGPAARRSCSSSAGAGRWRDRRRALAAGRARRALRRAPARAVGGPGRRRAGDRLGARVPRADGPVPDRRRVPELPRRRGRRARARRRSAPSATSGSRG